MRSARVTVATMFTLGSWLGSTNLGLQASQTPNFSGRWVLVSPPVLARQPLLILDAASELVVTQDARSFTVEHPAKPGSHPQPGTHRFGSSGAITSGDGRSWSDTFWFGAELIIESGTQMPGSAGPRSSWGEKWALEDDGRLEIRIVAERTGAAKEIVTLVYRRRDR